MDFTGGALCLALGAEVAGAAELLNLLDRRSALETRPTGGAAVHHTDIPARQVVKIELVVAATVGDDLGDRAQDGFVEGLALRLAQRGERVPGMSCSWVSSVSQIPRQTRPNGERERAAVLRGPYAYADGSESSMSSVS